MVLDKLNEPGNKPLPLLKLALLKQMLNHMRNDYGQLETLVESVQKRILDIQRNKDIKPEVVERRVNEVRQEAEKQAVEGLRRVGASCDLIKANEHWWTRRAVMQRARFFPEVAVDDYSAEPALMRQLAVETAEDTRRLRVMEELGRTPPVQLAERVRDAVELSDIALAFLVHRESQSRRYADQNEQARTINAVGVALQDLQLPELEQAEALIEEATTLRDRAMNRFAEVFKGRTNSLGKIKDGLRARRQQATAQA